LGSLLLIVGLIGIYSVLHMTVSQRTRPLASGLGAIVANGLLVMLYFIGATGLPVVGSGKGALAGVTSPFVAWAMPTDATSVIGQKVEG
jgi:hypothetical protein